MKETCFSLLFLVLAVQCVSAVHMSCLVAQLEARATSICQCLPFVACLLLVIRLRRCSAGSLIRSVLQIKRELHEHRQEILATQEIQQQQLDSLQLQVREDGQRLTETMDVVTELFRKQGQMQDLLLKLLADFSTLQVQSQPPDVSVQDIPATQPDSG